MALMHRLSKPFVDFPVYEFDCNAELNHSRQNFWLNKMDIRMWSGLVG